MCYKNILNYLTSLEMNVVDKLTDQTSKNRLTLEIINEMINVNGWINVFAEKKSRYPEI